MRGGLLSAAHKLSAHRLQLAARNLSPTRTPVRLMGCSRGGHRSHSWAAHAQDFVHPRRGGQGTGRAPRTPPALLAGQEKGKFQGEINLAIQPALHLLRSPNRRDPPLPGQQEKARRASLCPLRESGTAGREGRREGARAGPTARPGPAIAFPVLGSPPFQPTRGALPAAPALRSSRRQPLPCPVPGLPGKGRAPGPAAAGTGPGGGTYPPLAPAGKPCSRENMLDCSAESAAGFPPQEPALPRPRHEEGHRLPPGPLRSRGSRPHPSSSSRAGIHRLDKEWTGTGTGGQRLWRGRMGGRGGMEDEETRGDGVMVSAPPPLWQSCSPWSPPLWEPADAAQRAGAAAGTAEPGMLLSGLLVRVTQAQR